MSAQERVNVLVVTKHRQIHHCIKKLPQSVSNKYRIYFQNAGLNDPRTSSFDLLDYVEDAKQLIKKYEISVLYAAHDFAVQVSAAIAEDMPEFRAPSYESVFLCDHKYYARCFIDPDPIAFAVADLSTDTLDAVCNDVIQTVPFPAFSKPVYGCGSVGVGSIASKEQLVPHQAYFNSISTTTIARVPFYTKYVDQQQYPLSIVPSVLIEQHMGEVPIVNADGCVFEGEIIHWGISDNIYYTTRPQCFVGTVFPSELPQSTQENVWKLFDDVVRRMIEHGFNYQFVNLEMFVLDTGEVKLVEVNPRTGGSIGLYSHAVFNHSTTEALLKIGQGIHPGYPIANGCHAINGYISTIGSGKAEDFVDFSYPSVVPRFEPDDIIDGSGECGAVIARVCVTGDSRKEVLTKHKAILYKVLQQPELSVWE